MEELKAKPQPAKDRPRLTSAEELRAMPVVQALEAKPTPCLSILAPIVADVARLREGMSPVQARQAITIRLVGATLPRDLQDSPRRIAWSRECILETESIGSQVPIFKFKL